MSWRALLGLSLAGCGVLGFPSVPAGPGGDAGAGGDAGLASDAGPTGAWRETTPLPDGLALTCAVSLDDRIYLLGGGAGLRGGSAVADVLMAELATDGSITSWQPVMPLPAPTRWHACAVDVASRTLYVIGGDAGPAGRTTVWRTLVEPDGSLLSWGMDIVLPAPRRGLAAFVATEQLHAFGGESTDGLTVDSVYRADVSPVGTLGPWIQAAALPAPNYMFGAATVGDQAYLTGGWATPTAVLAGTTTGGLLATTPLPAPHWSHASVALAGYLYVLGGQIGAADTAVAEVRRAPVGPASVGAWESMAPLPGPVTQHAAVVAAGRIYVIGGLDAANQGLATVYVYQPPP